jgi:serine protease Do
VSIRSLSANELQQLGVKGGVYIQDVVRGGLASQSRIIPGDVVTQINNKAVLNPNDFVEAVSELKENTVARVAIVRQGQNAIVGLRIK